VIKRKKKPCKGERCDRVDYIVGRGLCVWCYNDYLKKKVREKKDKDNSIQQRQRKSAAEDGTEKTEIDIFNEIWNERPHVSEIDGTPLYPKGHKMWHWQFSHLLCKGAFPSARLNKENIVLKTWAQHQLWEFHAHKLRDNEEWRWVFEKRERLKREYHAEI